MKRVDPKIPNHGPLLALVSLLLFGLNSAAAAQTPTAPKWQETTEGLEMTLAGDGSINPGAPNLRVTFRNRQDRLIALVLGIVGGSGPRPCKLDNHQFTCNLNFTLFVTGKDGAPRKYTFRGISFVAGQLIDYVVYLEAHSTYTLELGFDQFWSRETREFVPLTLAPGTYQVALQFEGRAPESTDIRPEYLKKTVFWRGKLTSSTLTLNVPRGEE